jgi:hypothetical protein
MTKKIEYFPILNPSDETPHFPIPSVKTVPDWFKQIPIFKDNADSFKLLPNSKVSNTSVKWCSPFLDALSVGYSVTLSHDVLVTQVNGSASFQWKTQRNLIGGHSLDQFSLSAIPENYEFSVFKFFNNTTFQTPTGYSTLFTHPLNRFDLPFLTFSGIVDTDTHAIDINFPFILKKGFEGIIEEGTPIAQALPFKREDWVAEEQAFDKADMTSRFSFFHKKLIRSYKVQTWHKKSYQ